MRNIWKFMTFNNEQTLDLLQIWSILYLFQAIARFRLAYLLAFCDEKQLACSSFSTWIHLSTLLPYKAYALQQKT